MSSAVALAPPLTLGLLILVPYLQSRHDEPKTLQEFIERGIMEPPILHPGVVGVVVLAACALWPKRRSPSPSSRARGAR